MIQLMIKENNQLYFIKEKEEIEVNVKRCFPRSYHYKYLSLRNKKDEEVYLIEDMNKLNSTSKNALERILNFLDFKLNITDVISIEEEIELRNYHVLTNSGERKIQTKLEDWPIKLPDGSVLIQDLCGDSFIVSSLKELTKSSQKLLATYVE